MAASRSEDESGGTVDGVDLDALDEEEPDLDELDDPDEEALQGALEEDLEPAYVDEADEGADPSLEEIADAEQAAEEQSDDVSPVEHQPGAELDDDVLEELEELEELGDDEDVLREGEFICSSCHLVKRPSQLADATKDLCVDCV